MKKNFAKKIIIFIHKKVPFKKLSINLLHIGRVLGGEDVVDEDPGHRHFDRELDTLAHRHLKVELAVPKLGQVAAVLQTS